METNKHREGKGLAQSHVASRWQNLDSNPGLLFPDPGSPQIKPEAHRQHCWAPPPPARLTQCLQQLTTEPSSTTFLLSSQKSRRADPHRASPGRGALAAQLLPLLVQRAQGLLRVHPLDPRPCLLGPRIPA